MYIHTDTIDFLMYLQRTHVLQQSVIQEVERKPSARNGLLLLDSLASAGPKHPKLYKLLSVLLAPL